MVSYFEDKSINFTCLETEGSDKNAEFEKRKRRHPLSHELIRSIQVLPRTLLISPTL